jgi:KDO2-lipid IV(A) lauroyltransferase
MAGWLPPPLVSSLGRVSAGAYFTVQRSRREVVVRNLLPVVHGHRGRAAELASELFSNFGQKMADLLRHESGSSMKHLVREGEGWAHFVSAQSQGRGVLLLTAHIGNWEFGAPLLAARDIPVLVVTLVEPRAGLTELRQASRARHGIETLVIGEDPFAFVEVIRRLERGATVAMLIDRPLPANAVDVRMFGRRFPASIAAAELARATGCALLPVYLPRERDTYRAHLLPEISYDRRALGAREARHELTQEIVRAFEPIIQRYVTQWYHFIPNWPD